MERKRKAERTGRILDTRFWPTTPVGLRRLKILEMRCRGRGRIRLRRDLENRGRQRAREFTWQEAARRTLSVYKLATGEAAA